MAAILQSFLDLMHRGGIVMWPLLALSLLGVTLILERAAFWLSAGTASARRTVAELGSLLRAGDFDAARSLAQRHRSVYSDLVLALLREPKTLGTDAAAIAALDLLRPRLERFMGTLSSIISVSPMLGILGTVTGLMQALSVLGDYSVNPDPRTVGPGVAEALITTAAGLVVAILVLFPYNIFRTQLDEALNRFEALMAAVALGAKQGDSSSPGQQNSRT